MPRLQVSSITSCDSQHTGTTTAPALHTPGATCAFTMHTAPPLATASTHRHSTSPHTACTLRAQHSTPELTSPPEPLLPGLALNTHHARTPPQAEQQHSSGCHTAHGPFGLSRSLWWPHLATARCRGRPVLPRATAGAEEPGCMRKTPLRTEPQQCSKARANTPSRRRHYPGPVVTVLSQPGHAPGQSARGAHERVPRRVRAAHMREIPRAACAQGLASSHARPCAPRCMRVRALPGCVCTPPD